MVSDVSHDRLFGEENAGSRDLSPRSAIAPTGVLVMAPYLLIGAALWSNRGSTDAPGHESFMIILGVGVLVGRSHS